MFEYTYHLTRARKRFGRSEESFYITVKAWSLPESRRALKDCFRRAVSVTGFADYAARLHNVKGV